MDQLARSSAAVRITAQEYKFPVERHPEPAMKKAAQRERRMLFHAPVVPRGA
jgi:hypothetical protein